MYSYYNVDNGTWFESKHELQCFMMDYAGNEYQMTLGAPVKNRVMFDFIHERLVWCKLHLENFELFVMTNSWEQTKAWCFKIDDASDAMLYKLKWAGE